MKKHVLLCMMIYCFAALAFGQTATINGSNNSAFAVCAGSTETLTAGISGGFVPGDTLTWVQQINGGSGVMISRDAYTINQIITVPRDPSNPATVLPAAMGNTYVYTLVVKRGGSNYLAFITMTVNPIPTIGSVTSFVNVACGGTLSVSVNGLGPVFPLELQLWASADSLDSGPAIQIATQTVSSSTATINVNPLPWTNQTRGGIYLYAVYPNTGCIIGKQ